MTTLQVKLELPDPLAAEAQAAGLLAPEQLERMLREALRARRVEKLAAAREVLMANPLPPMTPEELQAEIDAYRAEVRRAAGTRYQHGDLGPPVARHARQVDRRRTFQIRHVLPALSCSPNCAAYSRARNSPSNLKPAG